MATTEIITDFITGKEKPNIGAEMNRQAVERYLVETKGYLPEDIKVGMPIMLSIDGETYPSRLDLSIQLNGKIVMVLKCPAGSIGSWERQTLAAARLAREYVIPYAVVSDGADASVFYSENGEKAGEGLAAIPSKKPMMDMFGRFSFSAFPAEKRTREQIIFRSYDAMSVHSI